MSREDFYVTDTNPNDTCGGRGCACSPGHVSDCVGPFVVFPGNEMDSILSPHVVLGAKCLRAAAAALDGEVLSAGEQSPAYEGTAEELPDEVEVPVLETDDADGDWVPEV